MFQTLSQVVSYSKSIYETSKSDDDKVGSPGYFLQDIQAVENALGTKFHPTFWSALLEVNLDTVSFSNAHFGGGQGYLDYLARINDHLPGSAVRNQAPIQVGSSDGYIFILNNTTGEIFVLEDGEKRSILAAASFEQFICRAASVSWMRLPQDEKEKLAQVEWLLTSFNVQTARRFWEALALGWA